MLEDLAVLLVIGSLFSPFIILGVEYVKLRFSK